MKYRTLVWPLAGFESLKPKHSIIPRSKYNNALLNDLKTQANQFGCTIFYLTSHFVKACHWSEFQIPSMNWNLNWQIYDFTSFHAKTNSRHVTSQWIQFVANLVERYHWLEHEFHSISESWKTDGCRILLTGL